MDKKRGRREPAILVNGAGHTERAGQLNYTPSKGQGQLSRLPLRTISGMIDLSLDRSDFHLEQANHFLRLATWHQEQAEAHRRIRRSLEGFIRPHVNREAVNG